MLPFFTKKNKIETPACWSILNKTLIDLMRLNESAEKELLEIASTKTISSIITLSEKEWYRIRSFGLFKEDKIDILLAITCEYLLKTGISSEKFETIIMKIASLIGVDTNLFNDSLHGEVSNEVIVSLMDIAMIRNLRIDSFDIPKEYMTELNILDIQTWGELAKLTEKSLVVNRGFNIATLRSIRALWEIKLLGLMAVEKMNGINIECYSSFSRMVETFIQKVCKTKRDNTIILHRIGLIDNRKTTFDEIGGIFDLTRERVRQICEKKFEKLKSPQNLKMLSKFWKATFEILRLSGGACMLDEIASSLAKRMEWRDKPGVIPLGYLLGLNENIFVDNSKKLAYDPTSACLNCKVAYSSLVALLNKNKYEMTVQEVAEHLLNECRNQPNCECYGWEFTECYLRLVSEKTDQIVIEDGMCYFGNTLNLERCSRVQLVERILFSAERALHLSEICQEIKNIRKDDKAVSIHNVSSWVRMSANLLLWDRGTYIHRVYVRIPHKLIREIETWLKEKLNREVPFVSVTGAFSEFELKLIFEGITSKEALYTCLRESNNSTFIYQRFPIVFLSGNEKLTVTNALESYVLDAGGLISYQKIKYYAVKKLYLEENYLNLYLSGAMNILNAGNRKYIHVHNFKFEKSKLKTVVNHAVSFVSKMGHVSVRKIYKEKQVSCNIIGINNPEMLYSVLKVYSENLLKTPGYPQILSTQYLGNNDENRGIIKIVVDYIALKNAPCSFVELEHHFVENLGYNGGTVNSVVFQNRILRYSQGSLVHINTLDWTNEKQQQLIELATGIIQQARKAGRFYALIDHLYDHHKLPVLGNDVLWTQTLLSELLALDDKFRILGSARNIFLLWQNEEEIESFEDFIYVLLLNNYEGAANLKSFERDMRNIGIIQKRITPSMLGNQQKVCIHDKVIMLKELQNSAKKTDVIPCI